MNDLLLGVIFAFLASLSWGVGAVLARVGMTYVPSRIATAISVFSGLSLMLLLALVIDAPAVMRISSTMVMNLFLIGIVQFVLGRFLNYMGISLAGTSTAMTLSSAAPLFAVALAVLFLGESVTYLIVIGTIAIVFGASVLVRAVGRVPGRRHMEVVEVVQPKPDLERLLPQGKRMFKVGVVASIMAAAAYGTVQTSMKLLISDGAIPPQVAALYTLLGGFVIMSLVAADQWRDSIRTAPKGVWLMMLAGIGSSLGVFFIFVALTKGPVVLVSPIANTSPLVVMLLTHRFLASLEAVSLRSVVGGTLTVLGVALVILGQT